MKRYALALLTSSLSIPALADSYCYKFLDRMDAAQDSLAAYSQANNLHGCGEFERQIQVYQSRPQRVSYGDPRTIRAQIQKLEEQIVNLQAEVERHNSTNPTLLAQADAADAEAKQKFAEADEMQRNKVKGFERVRQSGRQAQTRANNLREQGNPHPKRAQMVQQDINTKRGSISELNRQLTLAESQGGGRHGGGGDTTFIVIGGRNYRFEEAQMEKPRWNSVTVASVVPSTSAASTRCAMKCSSSPKLTNTASRFVTPVIVRIPISVSMFASR
jgi:hypothetical protein